MVDGCMYYVFGGCWGIWNTGGIVVMDISKGKYWDDACNPIVVNECRCEVGDKCWAHQMANQYGWKSGWFPKRLDKISVEGKAKVFAMCWLGDIGWKDNNSSCTQFIFRHLIYSEVRRLENGLPKHTFLFLTKWPAELYKGLSDLVDVKNTNIWIGTTITGDNIQRDKKRLAGLFEFEGFKKWISIEPLVNRPTWALPMPGTDYVDFLACEPDQIIVGAESGTKRPHFCDPRWAKMIIDVCNKAKTPCFVKQLHLSSFKKYGEMYISKNPLDWSEDLRVRELQWLKN